MYGTLNCGTSSELRDRGLRAEPPSGTSLLAGPYGTLPHRTEAVRGDDPHYRTLHREGRRRGTKALYGTSPLTASLRDFELRDEGAYGTSLLTVLPIAGLASLIRYSPLMDGGAYGTCFLTDFQLQDPSQGRTTKGAHGAPGRRVKKRLRSPAPGPPEDRRGARRGRALGVKGNSIIYCAPWLAVPNQVWQTRSAWQSKQISKR